jgi:K+-sensing histidine kinase KdpD
VTATSWLLAAAGAVGLTVLFTHHRATFTLATVLFLYLLLAVAVARAGGPLPAAAAGVAGFGLANWYFVTPQRQLAVRDGRDLLSLAVYLVAVATVVALVEEVRRLRQTLARSQAELVASRSEADDSS